jgi:hypothetical protein
LRPFELGFDSDQELFEAEKYCRIKMLKALQRRFRIILGSKCLAQEKSSNIKLTA